MDVRDAFRSLLSLLNKKVQPCSHCKSERVCLCRSTSFYSPAFSPTPLFQTIQTRLQSVFPAPTLTAAPSLYSSRCAYRHPASFIMSTKPKPSGFERDTPYDSFPSTSGSVPLLVKTLDGERHQIDLPPNSSIRDLKAHIANLPGTEALMMMTGAGQPNNNGQTSGNNNAGGVNNNPSASQSIPWDLDFAGSVLNENHTLEHYNIPDVYDHTNGLLKTISDSGYDNPEKQVEALDKALNVVRGISKGERDMERLIASVFEDEDNNYNQPSPTAQPTISSMRRTRRSRIPVLNLSQLAPIGAPLLSTISKDGKPNSKAGLPSAPPTPSQLIRRLSNFRPDLYDPKVIEKVADQLDTPAGHTATISLDQRQPQPSTHKQEKQPQPQPQPQQQQQNAKQTNENGAEGATVATRTDTDTGTKTGQTTNDVNNPVAGSGELKRGGTWFNDVITSFGTSLPSNTDDGSDDDGQNDIDADSEGEDESQAASTNNHDSNTIKNGNEHSIQGSQADSGGGKHENNMRRASGTESSASGTQSSSLHTRGDQNLSGHTGHKQDTSTRNDKCESNSTKSREDGENGDSSALDNTERAQRTKQVIGLEPEISMTAPAEPVRTQKKRGRKRKNPHLSEEERKAQRQAQNRESAKLSRIRRKNMTMEYEKRVNTLEGENENLRDTVAALTGRLEMLQNLLTISVQKRAIPGNPIAQLATTQQKQPQLLAPPQQPMNHMSMAPAGGLGGLATTGLNVPGLNSANGMSATGQLPAGVGMTNTLGGTQSMPPTSGALPNVDFNNM